jgi:ABC-type bacteriocin/lantibiotic exporter with double-glycine peptidase domain
MLITAAMLIVGSVLLISQQLNIGQFIASEIVILLVLNSVEKLILNLDKVYDVLTSVEKLGKLTDKPLDADGNLLMPEKKSGIEVALNDLSFSYDHELVLKSVTAKISAGQKVAIIGSDGSGKSTLLRVLTGAYYHYQGGIMMDNVPMRNYQADSLRAKTGILLSQQDIFHGTLLENITMGNDDVSPASIMELSESIGLKDFMEQQEKGFQTELDPVGKRLSRNVIQKILLLRALVNHPRLLLLEEPWTNLEPGNAQIIKSYLLNIKDSTVLVATSDAGFISKCDLVLNMQNGKLVRVLTGEQFQREK